MIECLLDNLVFLAPAFHILGFNAGFLRTCLKIFILLSIFIHFPIWTQIFQIPNQTKKKNQIIYSMLVQYHDFIFSPIALMAFFSQYIFQVIKFHMNFGTRLIILRRNRHPCVWLKYIFWCSFFFIVPSVVMCDMYDVHTFMAKPWNLCTKGYYCEDYGSILKIIYNGCLWRDFENNVQKDIFGD